MKLVGKIFWTAVIFGVLFGLAAIGQNLTGMMLR